MGISSSDDAVDRAGADLALSRKILHGLNLAVEPRTRFVVARQSVSSKHIRMPLKVCGRGVCVGGVWDTSCVRHWEHSKEFSGELHRRPAFRLSTSPGVGHRRRVRPVRAVHQTGRTGSPASALTPRRR